jgi:hypothetical protein
MSGARDDGQLVVIVVVVAKSWYRIGARSAATIRPVVISET